MYLTKLLLDPRSAAAQRDLANPYEMHRTLSRVFAESAEGATARFLWRLEPQRPGENLATVLVQSSVCGHWSVLHTIPNYLNEIHADKLVALAKLLSVGRQYHFRLLANPTVTRAGKRYGLLHEEEQQAWLHRQAEKSGFSILSAESPLSQRCDMRKGSQLITVQAVRFDGLLQAHDIVQLEKTLLSGIGHAKALGLGLLSLAPA